MSNNYSKYKWVNGNTNSLFRAILALESIEEARNFFRDLLTEQEIIEFGQRWKVARLLAKDVSYTQIEKETGMSSKTIARIQKWLKDGMGGYLTMINKLKEKGSL
jgi:TrpR-related protein YerC/YecD